MKRKSYSKRRSSLKGRMPRKPGTKKRKSKPLRNSRKKKTKRKSSTKKIQRGGVNRLQKYYELIIDNFVNTEFTYENFIGISIPLLNSHDTIIGTLNIIKITINLPNLLILRNILSMGDYSNVKEIDLSGCPLLNKISLDLFNRCINLETITVSNELIKNTLTGKIANTVNIVVKS